MEVQGIALLNVFFSRELSLMLFQFISAAQLCPTL